MMYSLNEINLGIFFLIIIMNILATFYCSQLKCSTLLLSAANSIDSHVRSRVEDELVLYIEERNYHSNMFLYFFWPNSRFFSEDAGLR